MNFYRAFSCYLISALVGFVTFYVLGILFVVKSKAADSASLDRYISENGGRGFHSDRLPTLSRTYGSNGLTEDAQNEARAKARVKRDWAEAERFVEERTEKIRRKMYDDKCDIIQRTQGTSAALRCLGSY